MNIIEAMKSGKRFRKGHRKFDYKINSHWEKDVPPSLHECKDHEWIKSKYFDLEDLLSDDWEIEEEKIEITKSQLDKFFDAMAVHAGNGIYSLKRDQMTEYLGFKE